MCVVTIWLNSIDIWVSPTVQQYHTLSLGIGFDGADLYTVDARGRPQLSNHGAVIFRKLQSAGLSVYSPDFAAQSNGFVATHELQRYLDGGYAPYLYRLLHQIARFLGECGLGEASICYKVSDEVNLALNHFDGSVWPASPGAPRLM